MWENGTAGAVEQAVRVAGAGDGIYLSFDVDSLDAAHAPGYLLPDPGRAHDPRGDRARPRSLKRTA